MLDSAIQQHTGESDLENAQVGDPTEVRRGEGRGGAREGHADRECEDVAGVAPCKIGQIIIEASADRPKPEIWQQQK